jgi:predicted RNA methylase
MNPIRTIKRSINRLRGEARVNGIALPIDRSVLSPHMELTLAAGRYERRERALSARIIRSGDVVLELGAGLGFLGSYLRKFTRAGKIVCVEANPHLIPYIARVHALNRIEAIEVLNGVVVPRDGEPISFPF